MKSKAQDSVDAKPGRKATGTVVYVDARAGEQQGHYRARITCADGSRPWIDLDPSPKSPQAEVRARETAAHYSEKFRERGIVGVPQRRASKPVRLRSGLNAESVADYVTRWFAHRERRGLSSIETDRGRMSNHVLPVIGHVPMIAITPNELRALVADLDRKVRDGTFSWKTAVRCWGLVTKLFDDAKSSKEAALRIREDRETPTAGVTGPDRGESKQKQWLYPSEASALLECIDVPLRWRRLYALAAYLYLRPGELAALEWADVQSEHGYVNVHQALDLRSGETKPTKTKHARKVPIHSSLAPLLETMRKESAGKGRVIQHTHANKEAAHGFPPLEDLAANLREHLARADVKRADLFADRSTTKRLTFYDLRATGITWEVLAGTEHVRIMQRAGHTNFSTTQGYIREADAVGLAVGEPFPTLPNTLTNPDESSQIVSANRPKVPADESGARYRKRKLASPTGFERAHGTTIVEENRTEHKSDDCVSAAPRWPKLATAGEVGPNGTNENALAGVVETALADALTKAAQAGQWEIVSRIAGELEARRIGRTNGQPAPVTALSVARGKLGSS